MCKQNISATLILAQAKKKKSYFVACFNRSSTLCTLVNSILVFNNLTHLWIKLCSLEEELIRFPVIFHKGVREHSPQYV